MPLLGGRLYEVALHQFATHPLLIFFYSNQRGGGGGGEVGWAPVPLAMPVTVRGSEATERWEDFTPSHGREIFYFIRRSLKTALSCTLNAIMGKLCEVAARICQQLGSKVRERSDGAGKGV